MTTTLTTAKPHPKPSLTIITLFLPGPDRKRTWSPYHFRLTYRNPEPTEPGCLMTWDVTGGRQLYQISLEKQADGTGRWHCTCADAVYRGEDDPHHICKHVQGLLDTFPTVAPPEPEPEPASDVLPAAA